MAKCRLCGYEWVPRVTEPRACPNCKSYKWKNKEEKKEIKY